MVATSNRDQNGLLDRGPVEHHAVVTHTKNRESLPKEFQIACAVPLVAVTKVVASTVELKDQAVADEHIDPADPINLHLRAHPDAASTQPQASESFQARLRTGIDEVRDP
jgi:hypothetical protein